MAPICTNREHVRKYYERNKSAVCHRKVLQRARDRGSIPSISTVLRHNIPVQTIMVAFSAWVAKMENVFLIRQQISKLDSLRIELSAKRTYVQSMRDDPTPEERRALLYLRRCMQSGI